MKGYWEKEGLKPGFYYCLKYKTITYHKWSVDLTNKQSGIGYYFKCESCK